MFSISNKKMRKVIHFFFIATMLVSTSWLPIAHAKPKITTTFGFSIKGFPRMQVKNETNKSLACWVAIDGFKKKFRLPPFTRSKWITVYDKRYSYQNFSTWCDFIDHHPEYKKYGTG